MPGYITLDQLKDFGVSPSAFINETAEKRTAAINAASRLMDGYLGNRFTLPLADWEDDIRECCAVLASIQLIRNRGTNPDDETTFESLRKERIDWLMNISKGLVTPQATDSSSGAAEGVPSFQPRVVSASSRGWSNRGTGNPRIPFQGD